MGAARHSGFSLNEIVLIESIGRDFGNCQGVLINSADATMLIQSNLPESTNAAPLSGASTIMLPTIIELLCKIIVSRVPLFIYGPADVGAGEPTKIHIH